MIRECFCKSFYFGDFEEKNTIDDITFDMLNEICSDWITDYIYLYGTPYVSMLIVIISNVGIGILISILSELEKHKFLSLRLSSKLSKVFWGLFINTVNLIIILIF